MQSDSSIDFFDENERRVNIVVVKLYSLFTFAGPVMLAARYFNIFPKANYTFLFAYTLYFAARIMAAADVLDALLSKRPYKEALSVDETLSAIKRLSGRQFDPKVVEAMEAIRASLVAS